MFDGFLGDPDAWRTEALAASYWRPHPRFPWHVSKEACSGLTLAVQRISRLIGLPLRDWHAGGDGSTVGRFHINLAGAERLANFHADPFDLAAVLYLSPEPPAGSGTRFSRTVTRIRRRPGEPLKPVPLGVNESADTADTFEVVNQYNRLVIYRGARYHRASGYFGRSRKSGRLTVAFFFNVGARRSPAMIARRTPPRP
ncbi:MAG: hypothetical protein AB7F36_01790 [Reyranellaceae bacterium]